MTIIRDNDQTLNYIHKSAVISVQVIIFYNLTAVYYNENKFDNKNYLTIKLKPILIQRLMKLCNRT